MDEWTLTALGELADILNRLRIVADWARRVYVAEGKDYLTHLSNGFGHSVKDG